MSVDLSNLLCLFTVALKMGSTVQRIVRSPAKMSTRPFYKHVLGTNVRATKGPKLRLTAREVNIYNVVSPDFP